MRITEVGDGSSHTMIYSITQYIEFVLYIISTTMILYVQAENYGDKLMDHLCHH